MLNWRKCSEGKWIKLKRQKSKLGQTEKDRTGKAE